MQKIVGIMNEAYFESKGYSCVKVNSKKGGGLKSIQAVIQEACKEKIERDRRKGILNRPVRAMVVGIPNVGKSTFINSLAGKAAAKTGNKAGSYKRKAVDSSEQECGTSGYPRYPLAEIRRSDRRASTALIGSIKDEITNIEELASELIKFMTKNYSGVLADKYGINEDPGFLCMSERNRRTETLSGAWQ